MKSWEMMEDAAAIELRPEVLAFARMMEQRLREKDADKGQSWKLRVLDDLNVHAITKMTRLDSAIAKRKESAAAQHAVDLANYCMMIADVSGALVSGT